MVDDDDAMRDSVVEILTATGIEAEGAATAAEARALQPQLAPGVALVDQRLPDSSGVELGSLLKERDADLTVVLVTGYASLENAIAAVWEFDGYLTKPVAPPELVRVVRAGLEHARLRRENRALLQELRTANLSLETSVVDRTSELSGLLSLAEALAGSSELDTVIDACLRTASQVTDARHAGLYLAEDSTGTRLRASSPGSALPERLDADTDRVDAGLGDVLSLTAGGQNLGALVLAATKHTQPMFLTTLAASAAVAIQNAQRFGRERETVEKLSEVSRVKSTFLATVSHELRTPLAAVLGLAELLSTRYEGLSPERRKEIAAQILDQGRHLSILIEDILDATRAEFGGLRVELDTVDIGQIATRIGDTFNAAGYPLRVHVTPGLPSATADEARLIQVLTNLASNAFKHSSPDTPVELHATAADDRVSIAVKDRGNGIDPQFLTHIFEPFTQAATTSGREDGLGLGLYIAHGLVHAMGGTIDAHSRVGEGSEFVVYLKHAQART